MSNITMPWATFGVLVAALADGEPLGERELAALPPIWRERLERLAGKLGVPVVPAPCLCEQVELPPVRITGDHAFCTLNHERPGHDWLAHECEVQTMADFANNDLRAILRGGQ